MTYNYKNQSGFHGRLSRFLVGKTATVAATSWACRHFLFHKIQVKPVLAVLPAVAAPGCDTQLEFLFVSTPALLAQYISLPNDFSFILPPLLKVS